MRTGPDTRAVEVTPTPFAGAASGGLPRALTQLVQMMTAPTRAQPLSKDPCQLLSGLADVAASHHELGIGPGRQQIEVP